MPANPTTAAHRLGHCLSGALGRPLAPSDLPVDQGEWEKILRISSAHLAAPQLRWALREQGLFSHLPADVADYLDAIYTLNLDRNLKCEDQLAHLISVLNSIDVRPVLLKGAAAIVGGLYPTSGERMISDLDILIPAETLPEILDKLTGLGYRPWLAEGMDRPNPDRFSAHHHYPLLINQGWPAHVELHLHPVNLNFVELLPSDEIILGARELKWRGGECLLPSATHFITHNIIHAFLVNTQYKLERLSLRQLFELVLASRTYGEQIDWDGIRNHFDRLGYGKALRQYLALATTCLDFHVPDEIEIDESARTSIRPYLFHLELENRSALWTINLVQRMRAVLRSLRKRPRRAVRNLFSTSAYTRVINSIRSGPKA